MVFRKDSLNVMTALRAIAEHAACTWSTTFVLTSAAADSQL
jgi:hypothetical protein